MPGFLTSQKVANFCTIIGFALVVAHIVRQNYLD